MTASMPSRLQVVKQAPLQHQSTELEVRDVAVGLRKMSEIGRFGIAEDEDAPVLFKCLKVSDFAN